MSAGRLIVCPTPIGNLGDITLRALDALRDADVLACEDTRRTRVLLDRHGIETRLISYHEHNERGRIAELVQRIGAGATVGLVSDAGMPLISDPGYVLVRACVQEGLTVEVLPGPSAVLCGLVASALPADRWRFVGFLPRKAGELRALAADPLTTVAFEAPGRLAASLQVLAEVDPQRPVAVCRELTKLHEEILRGSASDLAARTSATPVRGEVVVVFGGAPEGEADLRAAVAAVRGLIEAGARTRPAAGVVAQLTGVSANVLYRAVTDASGEAPG